MIKTYKLLDKKTTGCLIIYIDKLPFLEECHWNLLNLSREIDLFFIFPKSFNTLYYPSKISTLYSSVFYSISDKNQVESIWTGIEYITELYDYKNVSIILSSELLSLDLNKIIQFQFNPIENSVFKTRYLNNNEFIDIYRKPKLYSFKSECDLGMYSSKTTEDKIIFLRLKTINLIKKSLESDFMKFYFETFRESNFKTFISSIVSRICPETLLNQSVLDVKY